MQLGYRFPLQFSVCFKDYFIHSLWLSHQWQQRPPQMFMDCLVLHFAPNMKGKPCYCVAFSKVIMQPSADSCTIVVPLRQCTYLHKVRCLHLHGLDCSMSYLNTPKWGLSKSFSLFKDYFDSQTNCK